MELVAGFVLGILASVIASFLFAWLSASRQRPLLRKLRHPLRHWKIYHRSPEREIAVRIRELFSAWEKRSINAYLTCWTDDCVRIQGSGSNVTEGKSEIEAKFRNSVAKYEIIKVPILLVEDVAVMGDGETATADVYYRFELIRTVDRLPTIEESREVYSLRKVDAEWKISANIDHFSEITAAQKQNV